jgi:DNA-directed RNA polymerase specialized sigma24 family protein
MAPVPSGSPCLDQLSARACAGDTGAEAALFADLRVRFLTIAKHRVREDSLEDVVHDALRIVHEKYRGRTGDRGILIWSLTVLRNVIGNWYQAKARANRRQADLDLHLLPAPEATVSPEAIFVEGEAGAREMAARLEEAIAALARRHPRCGAIFQHILDSLARGGGPREISQRALARMQEDEPSITPGSFYTALHRCRSRLRQLLDVTEERGGHV